MTRRRLAWMALVTALLLVAAHAALAAPLISFSCSPSCSVTTGTTVTFTDTSNMDGETVSGYEWDLDGDGLYGIADTPDEPQGPTQTQAQRNFPTPGTYTVRLKVRWGGGDFADTASKTITVTDPAPQPQPQPQPPPNKPPLAKIDFKCDELPPGGIGAGFLCPAQVGIAGQPHTFDGSPSSDPDGHIVKYEWDLDNNGSFEKSGSSPLTTKTLPDAGTVNYKLRVTDDDGATNVATSFVIVKADCQPKVTFKRLTAKSTCFKRSVTSSPNGFGKVATYKSSYTVNVNGLLVTPASGKTVKVKGIVDAKGALLNAIVLSDSASVYVKVQGAKVRLHKGKFSWAVTENGTKLGSFKIDSFNGLQASGLEGPTLSTDKVTSKLKFYLAMPQGMGGATSTQKVVLTPGKGANAAAGAFKFSVDNGSIGPIGLKKLTVSYDGDGLWEIAGKVALPAPIPYSISAGLGIDSGKFKYGEAEINFGSPGIGPFGPVFIQRIKFRIEIKPNPNKPSTSKCVPKIGIEHFNVDTRVMHKIGIHQHPAVILDFDHGVPDFALCGEVGLSAGPQILGARAIGLDAGLGFATYPDRPAVFRAFGKLYLVEIPIAQARFEVHTNGYTRMSAEFKAGIDDLATIEGFIKFEMLMPKFNAEAFIEACVGPIDLCLGARGLISSKGLAICLKGPFGASPGVAYKWGGSLHIYFLGCSVGPYKEYINASASGRRVRAAGADQAIDVPAGTPAMAIGTTGQGAPPKITVTGPSGQTYTTPDSDKAVTANDHWVLKDRRFNTTSFMIVKPQAGRWLVKVDADSVPVTSIQKANFIERPKITARVTGRGHRRVLRYEVKKDAGDQVSFVEDGPSTGRTIGVARGSHGSIAFTPADGRSEQRDIAAVVERDGFVADRFNVTSYRAPGVFRPAKPRKLLARRRGTTLAVRWLRSAGAGSYEVKVALGDGRRLLFLSRGNRLTVRRVARGLRATITVSGVSDAGMKGRAAKAKVKVRKPQRRAH